MDIQAGHLKLNPFFRVRMGEPLLCDLLLNGMTFELPDSRYLSLLASAEQTRSRTELATAAARTLGVDEEEGGAVIDDLVLAGVLVAEDHDDVRLPAVRHWIERGWLEALLLHLRSRDLRFADDATDTPDSVQDSVMAELVAEQGPPEIWKQWPGRTPIALPGPGALPDRPFAEVLLSRRSNRPWKRGRLTLAELSTILHHGNRETRRLRVAVERELPTRPSVLLNSAFSALESYFFAFAVDGLESGLYHYDPCDHQVVLVRSGLLRDELVTMCIGQSRPREAAAAFLITAVWARYAFRYRHTRAYRTLLVNVAELAQKYILLATTLGLSTFLTPALRDEYADELVGVNGYDEAPLYVVACG
jgi:SagB-type dehydrogenase family enzyme